MTLIRPDVRRVRAERCPDAERRLREASEPLRDLEFQVARDLAEVDAKAAFVFSGCASVVEYAVRLGYDGRRALDLCWLGKALATTPDLEARIRGRDLSFAAACVVGRVLGRPDLVKPGEDWIARAGVSSLRDLVRAVRLRLEEGRQGQTGLVEMSFVVTAKTQKDFERCRVIASRAAGKELSESQTFQRMVDHFLDRLDETRRKSAARRVGETGERPDDRYVPADVVRAISERSGGRCEVGGCDRVAVERAHVKPHANGSGREARDLWGACHRHHVLYDAGLLRFRGFREDGKPRIEPASDPPPRGVPGGAGRRHPAADQCPEGESCPRLETANGATGPSGLPPPPDSG